MAHSTQTAPPLEQDRLEFRKLRIRAVAFPFLMLLLFGLVLGAQVIHLLSLTSWLDHTDQVIADVNHLAALLLEEERDYRAHGISGRREFADHEATEQAQIAQDLRELKAEVADNPVQLTRVAELEKHYGIWLAGTRRGYVPAYYSTPDGRLLMDGIQSELKVMVSQEEGLRSRRGVDTRATVVRLFVVACVFALTVAGGLAYLSYSQLQQLARIYSSAVSDAASSADRLAEEKRALETLYRLSGQINAQLDPEKLLQEITDRSTELTGAEFGAFFYNHVAADGEKYLLYTLSGAPRETFAAFPMPRNTAVFGPTFRGEGIIRLEDVTQDPRYGKNPPYHGMPPGHLQVRSYLAAPVISRSGEVLGGLFLGHSRPGIFGERAESLVGSVAAQAAVAIDNARLYAASQSALKRQEKTVAELTRSNAELSQFAYVASHDLKEPLRMVTLYVQLLAKRYREQLDNDARDFIDYAVEGADRMRALIDSILAYSQVGREGSEIVEINCHHLIEQVGQALESLIAESQARIEVESLPVITGDRTQLSQLFQNLIHNAIKFRDPATAPRIRVTAQPIGSGWRFAVKDNGIGISAEHAGKVFRIFQRLHSRAEYPGTGIGLAICKKIVESHGGDIWLESAPGKGSTFYFTLPV